MKKLSKTYKELGIAFSFPIRIEDVNGNETYCEYSNGYCSLREYDAWGNETYFKNNEGYCCRKEYDANGKLTYYENSNGIKRGNNRIYCDGKVVEVDGKKYQLKEIQ